MPSLKHVNMKNEAKTWVHIEMGLNPRSATNFVHPGDKHGGGRGDIWLSLPRPRCPGDREGGTH